MFFYFFSRFIFIDNKCYKIVQDTTLNFDAASKACSDQGKEYSLVSIHSELENGNVFLIFTNHTNVQHISSMMFWFFNPQLHVLNFQIFYITYK